jgi:hypothetical protein
MRKVSTVRRKNEREGKRTQEEGKKGTGDICSFVHQCNTFTS